eukprot:13844253-Heterocapsa_arctica.AAC.1
MGNPGAIFDMDKMAIKGWAPWKSVIEWLWDIKVWGTCTETDFWNIIMDTKSKQEGYYSYMVKHWEDTKTKVIKLAPNHEL